MDIRQEIQQVFEELEKHQFGDFPGIGDETVRIEPSEEAQALLRRGTMLAELTRLREPAISSPRNDWPAIEFSNDWAMCAHFGMCPCPGVPDHMWQEPEDEGDPMGDWHGRNE